MNLVLSPEAADDLERLHAFLAKASPGIAAKVALVLDEAVESLAVFPNRGKPSGIESLRELIVPFARSAYVIRYVVEHDSILILRIWHGREDR